MIQHEYYTYDKYIIQFSGNNWHLISNGIIIYHRQYRHDIEAYIDNVLNKKYQSQRSRGMEYNRQFVIRYKQHEDNIFMPLKYYCKENNISINDWIKDAINKEAKRQGIKELPEIKE